MTSVFLSIVLNLLRCVLPGNSVCAECLGLIFSSFERDWVVWETHRAEREQLPFSFLRGVE